MLVKKFMAVMAAITIAPFCSAGAATVDPGAFDLIITEGKRTATLDGADISGNNWNARNSDVRVLDIGLLSAGDDVLLAGRVTPGGADVYFSAGAGGTVQVHVFNFAERSREADPELFFAARFGLFVDDVPMQSMDLAGFGAELIENQAFAPVDVDGGTMRVGIFGLDAITDYDVGISALGGGEIGRGEDIVAGGGLQAPEGGQDDVAAVPAPAALPLMLGALSAFGFAGRRRLRG